jgi:hypothetical protein
MLFWQQLQLILHCAGVELCIRVSAFDIWDEGQHEPLLPRRQQHKASACTLPICTLYHVAFCIVLWRLQAATRQSDSQKEKKGERTPHARQRCASKTNTQGNVSHDTNIEAGSW